MDMRVMASVHFSLVSSVWQVLMHGCTNTMCGWWTGADNSHESCSFLLAASLVSNAPEHTRSKHTPGLQLGGYSRARERLRNRFHVLRSTVGVAN